MMKYWTFGIAASQFIGSIPISFYTETFVDRIKEPKLNLSTEKIKKRKKQTWQNLLS